MKRLILVFGIILTIVLVKSIFPVQTASAENTSVQAQTESTIAVGDAHAKSGIIESMKIFLSYTSFANITTGHCVMIMVGFFFLYLAIRYDYEPLLLVPIGTGIIVGNIPFPLTAGLQIGIYEQGRPC